MIWAGLLLLLPWASIVCLFLSAWFWWKASARIEIPKTIGFVQSPIGEGGPIKKLDAVLDSLREQSRLNAKGAIWAAAAVILLVIERTIQQWDILAAFAHW
jgi:hypothetical protein